MEGFIISSIVCCIMYLANRGASVRKYEQIEYEKKEKITYDQIFNFINVAELQSIKKTNMVIILNKLNLILIIKLFI